MITRFTPLPRPAQLFIHSLFLSEVLFVRVMSRARNYMFTINFGDAQVTELLPEEFPEWMTFVVWQLECGEEGTMHYQGYVECSGKRSFAAIQSVPGFEGCHLEVRRGTQGQAIAYCEKDDDTRVDGPWRHGEPKQQVFFYHAHVWNGFNWSRDGFISVYDRDYFDDVFWPNW